MMAKKYDIEFLYRDFRVGFREGQAKQENLDCICKSIVVVFFQRKTDIVSRLRKIRKI